MKLLQALFIILFFFSCSEKQTVYEYLIKDEAFKTDKIDQVNGAFVELSNGFTYYEEKNSDSTLGTLVLIHGFSVPSYIWEETFQSASKKGYRVIRMDLYGRGYSENPDVAYSDSLFANQVIELLDYLEVSKANFFGLSNGGRVISKIALLNPDIVGRLVYVSSSGFWEKVPPYDRTVSEEEIKAFITTYPTLAQGQLADLKNPEQFPEWDDKYNQLLKYKGFGRALLSTLKNHQTLDKEHQFIHESGIPVFTIWGESDQVVVYDTFKDRLEQLLPNRVEVFITDAAHLPQMENQEAFETFIYGSVLNN